MKEVSAAFRTHLRKGHTSFARLWSVALTNGLRFYLTDHDQDIFFDGQLYLSDPGITVSAIQDTIQGGFSDATIEMAVTEQGISEDMVRYGVLSGATFNLERVFYDKPELGSIFDFGGSIREVVINDKRALQLSVDGAGSIAGGIEVGEVYSERCRNVFGDFRCKVDLTKLEVPFTVVGTDTTKTKFYASISLPEDYEPQNPEVAKVKEFIFNEPGIWNYEIPECTELSVIVLGAGGGQGDLYSPIPIQPAGGDGANSYFGDVIAFGGKGGGLFHNGANGGAQGGSYNGSDGQPGGKGVDAQGRAFGGFGGDGGKALMSYKVGPGLALQPGQLVTVRVGVGGTSNTTPGIAGMVAIYYREPIETIDDNESISFGTIRWMTGNNANFIHAISSIEDQLVTMEYNLNFPIKVGDTGLFRPGCNHYRSDCKKYNNIPNYRGEPDVPNVEAKPPVSDPTVPPPNTSSNMALPFATGIGGGPGTPI